MPSARAVSRLLPGALLPRPAPRIGSALLAVAALCLTVQLISATFLVQRFETPNASPLIAKNLVSLGRYEGGTWIHLKGPYAGPADAPPKVFQLPGEPLYLSFWFRLLPEGMLRYIHVPVTVLLVTATACVAALWLGTWAGLLTGVVASVQPFIVMHGPVWDDTFFAAALVWTVIALLCARLLRPPLRSGPSVPRLLLLAGVVAFGSITRVQVQVVLLLIVGAMLVVPAARKLRWEIPIIVLSMALAVGGWGYRNLLEIGEFTVSSTHDGVSLWLSNNPSTRDSLQYGQVERLMNEETMGVHWRAAATMSETEANRYYVQETVKYIIGHPVEVGSTSLLKLAISLAGIRPEQSLLSLRNLPVLLSNVLLLLLAAYGAYLVLLRDRHLSRVVMACFFAPVALAGLAMLLFGPIGLRYRVALDPILWIAASVALLRCGSWITGQMGVWRRA